VLRLLTRYRLTDRLREMLEQAGLQWNLARLIHGCLAVFLAVFAVAWLALPGDLRSFAVFPQEWRRFCRSPTWRARRARRLYKFEEQFPESLEFVARSMRAGHAFTVSLEMIHREFQERWPASTGGRLKSTTWDCRSTWRC